MKEDKLKHKLFEEICNIYSKDLQRFIYSLTRKDQYAMEEIFQNTLIEAYQGLERLREIDKMKSWIYSIAKAEARRYYSKNQNVLFVNDIAENIQDNIFYESNFDDFTKMIEDKELIILLLNKLSEEEQQIYILHYYYDIPLKEISKILHINYNTIKTTHVRGLSKFKKLLVEEKFE